MQIRQILLEVLGGKREGTSPFLLKEFEKIWFVCIVHVCFMVPKKLAGPFSNQSYFRLR